MDEIVLLTPPVERSRLGNGLRLLVSPRPGDPVAAVTLWVGVGYLDEADPETGLSHVLEHMFFQGSENFPGSDRMAREIKDLGGHLNAATDYDSTRYYAVLPAANLSRALEIQADALLRPRIDPEVLDRELGAIVQEAARKRDSAPAFALEKGYEAAFLHHRIRRWRMGEDDRIRSYRREDLIRFRERFYRTDRIVVSVAGGVDPEGVRRQVETLFGGMRPPEGETTPGPEEPPQREFRHRRIAGDIHRAHVILIYHAPGVLHPDTQILRVLAVALGTGRDSRLFRSIREGRRLASDVGASIEALRDIGVFTLTAETDPGDAGRAAQAILEEVGRAGQGIREEEMDRARALLESRFYAGRADSLGLSLTLARFESLGDYRLMETFLERLFSASASEVAEAAARYLDPSRLTLLEYLPSPALPAAAPVRPVPAGPPAPAAPGPGPAVRFRPQPAPSDSRPAVEAEDPGGGLRLLLQPLPGAPIASATLLIPGGKIEEDRATNGVTQLTLAAMLKGSARWPGAGLAAEIERLGAGLGREIADDFFGFSVAALSRRFPRALEVLFDLVLHPRLEPGEIEIERRNQIAALRRGRDESMPHAFRLFRRAVFAGTNYALPVGGTEASVRRLDPGRVRDWHRRTLRSRGAVLAVAGDFAPAEVRAMVSRWALAWPDASPAPDPSPRPDGGGSGARTRSARGRRHQTAQVVGFPAPSIEHPDRHPLHVLQAITSGLGGRWFAEIRSRRGLAYTVSSMVFQGRAAGAFLVFLATAPDREREARRVLLDEIERLRRDGPDEEEVRRAVRFLQGSHLVGLQTGAAVAAALAEAEISGLGHAEVREYPARIGAVTRESVNRVIRTCLDPHRLRLGILRGA